MGELAAEAINRTFWVGETFGEASEGLDAAARLTALCAISKASAHDGVASAFHQKAAMASASREGRIRHLTHAAKRHTRFGQKLPAGAGCCALIQINERVRDLRLSFDSSAPLCIAPLLRKYIGKSPYSSPVIRRN